MPATKLAFEQTPNGAWVSGQAGSVQPIIQAQDASNVLDTTDNTTQVVATISRGNGTLVGSVTVTCVAGRAVFTNLGIAQFTVLDDVYKLTFSKVGGGLTPCVSYNIYVVTSTAQPVTLPQYEPDTTMPAMNGNVLRVMAGGDLQAALNAAQPRDVIVLDHTGTWLGNFNFPAKTGQDGQPGGNNVITIISDAVYDFGFLPRGKRVSIADALNMPKIFTNLPNGIALSTVNGVTGMGGWRLVGLEVGSAPGNTADMTRIMRFGDEVTLVDNGAKQPFNFGVDRCLIHGNPTQSIQHAISMHASYSFVIDSYIYETHHNGADSQAVWIGQQAQGVLCDNVYAEASGENIFVGGSDGIDGFPCADITIRRCYMFKPKKWNPNDPSYDGSSWVIKNLFEIKFGRRILVEACVLDGCWTGGQAGFAFLIKANNVQAIPTTDVTIRNNLVRNVAGFIDLNGQLADTAPAGSMAPWMARVNFYNNGCHSMGSALYDPAGQVGEMFMNLEHMADITLEHNTALAPRHYLALDDPSVPFNIRLVAKNNLGSRGSLGVKCGGQVEGTASLAAVTYPNGNYLFLGNVLATSNGGNSGSAGYPTGNFFAASVAALGLQDSTLTTRMDLAPASPYKGVATDGKDPGVDWAALSAAIANTESGDQTGGGGGGGGSTTPVPPWFDDGYMPAAVPARGPRLIVYC